MDLQPSHHQQHHLSQNLHSVFSSNSIFVKKELRFILSFLILIIFTVVVSGPFNAQFMFRFGLLSQFLPNYSKSAPQPCNYSHGRWVRDDSYPIQSYSENCQFLDPGFRCSQNGRKDEDYRKWRWQPHGCDLPRWVCLRAFWLHMFLLYLCYSMHAWFFFFFFLGA